MTAPSPGIWGPEGTWPHPPLGFLFIAHAVCKAAVALGGKFDPDAGSVSNFDEAVVMLAEAGEARRLRFWCQWDDGDLRHLDEATFRRLDWRQLFLDGHLLIAAAGDREEYGYPGSDRRTCWIFVRRDDLGDFLETKAKIAPHADAPAHRFRYPGDAALVQRGVEMVKSGTAALRAAKILAKETTDGDPDQRTERLRKLISEAAKA